jgi:flavodoxin
MKTIVIYKSKTGFTKKYAQWIAAELSADLLEAAMVAADKLAAYDTVPSCVTRIKPLAY